MLTRATYERGTYFGVDYDESLEMEMFPSPAQGRVVAPQPREVGPPSWKTHPLMVSNAPVGSWRPMFGATPPPPPGHVPSAPGLKQGAPVSGGQACSNRGKAAAGRGCQWRASCSARVGYIRLSTLCRFTVFSLTGCHSGTSNVRGVVKGMPCVITLLHPCHWLQGPR